MFLTIFYILFFIITLGMTTPAFAADCSEATAGGSLKIDTACGFQGTVNGVDSGTGTQNTANLSIDPGGTLTVFWGQALAVGSLTMNGGSMVLINGSSVSIGAPLWMVDQDADGYPASTDQYIGKTPPANARRRNELVTLNTSDRNDSYHCPDGYNPDVTCNYCSTGTLSPENQEYDRFGQCPLYHLCNGSGACSLYAKKVFVSSVSYSGLLRGLSGADQKCQDLATSANLSGTWKAWLSDSTASAGGRLNHWTHWYILTDGMTKIADNWAGLTSGSLLSSINKTENGATVSAQRLIWTNTGSDGSKINTSKATTCNNWSSSLFIRNGVYGTNSQYTSAQWTNTGSDQCNRAKYLYCLEQ